MGSSAKNRDVIVLGTSAGGLPLLRKLVAGLPGDLPAAIFLVMHTSPAGPGYLAEILAARSAMRLGFARDGERIEPGRIYVARPDFHLLLDPGKVVVSRGPRENRFRPAIDPLFRSAAAHYGPRVIGVILSGMLDDGASGLAAVKDCGGLAVVQDAAEADFPQMIEAAKRAVAPDHIATIDGLPALLARLTQEPATMSEESTDPKALIRLEADLATMRRGGAEDVSRLGKLSGLVCPECSGALWEMDDERLLRYRCHVGHAYSAESLAADQAEALDRALSVALRTLDDTAALSARLAREAEEAGRPASARIFRARHEESQRHAATVRGVIQHQRGHRATPEAAEPA